MMRALLVALDSSPYARSAIKHAVELGRSARARLTALHVLDVRQLELPPYLDYSYVPEPVPPVVLPSELMERFRAQSERILQEAREEGEAAGLVVEMRAVEGVPSQVIADLGASHDLVVLGKRGEHAKWGRDFLGSTAEQVTRRSVTPVLLTEVEHRPLHRVLLLFDGSPPANRSLKLVTDLAMQVPFELEVLTVDDDLSRAATVQAEAADYVGPLGLGASYVVLPGRAAKVAPQRLKDAPADVVVLGMRGHSILHNLILGRTAEQLMRQVPLPVLLVP